MAGGWWGGISGSGAGGGGVGGSGSGYLVSDLIEEARELVNDGHSEEDGWIKPERWMRYLNWEVQRLARLSVQMNYVRPPTTEEEFTGPSDTIVGVMTFLGVLNSDRSPLINVQDQVPEPVWATDNDGPATYYQISATGDDMLVELNPQDASTYTARFIPLPAYVTAVTDFVMVPQGFERRLVCGMVEWAMIKEGGTSALLAKKITQADSEIAFTYAGRSQGAKPGIKPNGPRQDGRPWWMRFRR